MIFEHPVSKQNALRDAITKAYRQDETTCVDALIKTATLPQDALHRIHEKAKILLLATRQNSKKKSSLDKFLHEYDLSSEEGIALMCLAEALLRIPDAKTVDLLISDKIGSADWEKHLSQSDSLFVNAATWSLMLTGKILSPTLENQKKLSTSLKRFLGKASSTLIRPIVLQGMKIIGKQFVMGSTIDEAIQRAKKLEAKGYRYSYDMLGEAARTTEDANHYFNSYQKAIAATGAAACGLNPITGPGVSIKLSALHPRYEVAQRDRVLQELTPKLLTLAKAAKEQNIGMVIDAEEADRLELSLDIIEKVFNDPALDNYAGLGLAVQAYQKRAPFVIDWLASLAKQKNRRFMVRLIKGAYWDYEIKQAQLLGLEGYPVFTRKNSTDVSYLAVAKKILGLPDCFYPQFGTHNAYSVAAILEMAGDRKDFEFQCLHGMGEALYDQIVSANIPCRIYAPVGSHKDLLGYLVRRLLENGANTSFINRLADENIPVEQIIYDPIERIAKLAEKPHPHIPLPKNIFSPERLNSSGLDLSNTHTLNQLKENTDKIDHTQWLSGSIIAGEMVTQGDPQPLFSPADTQHTLGHIYETTLEHMEEIVSNATHAFSDWANTDIQERVACLERAAELFSQKMPAFITLLCREGGKHINDAIAEIRETIDYCRYYAARARQDFKIQVLKGPTGEYNQLSLHPRGVFICISPWNFPLAIFTGQIVAALVTGNTVIAKPAEQTPIIATEAIRLLHQAGIPACVLQLLIGKGSVVGHYLLPDERIAGVMFTGSTETAKIIQRSLANRNGPIVPFIAETGGQNAMIVDSSALAEQVVIDILQSAFNSAGQRCSALRVLFVQEEMAPHLLNMLKNAMAELTIGDPSLLKNDIGPVIDQEALEKLQNHFNKMQQEASLIYQIPLTNTPAGYYFAPCVFELKNLKQLQQEVFGPILHVIRYQAHTLDQVVAAIQETGYGLTCGIHSRIDATVRYLKNRLPVGNLYVNRNIIGAVVGVQPFGGEHLSGTGPKAGGPYYLPRLCLERALSINTTAAGGNASLVSLSEDEL